MAARAISSFRSLAREQGHVTGVPMQPALAFLRAHWLHAVLIVPGALLITLLHESAHAAVVTLQGGSVAGFQWLPTSQGFGHISFTFPRGVEYSRFWIALAPHVLSLLAMVTGTLLAWRRSARSDRIAAIVFFWLFFVPAADLAFALLTWLFGGQNDMADAFGKPRSISVVLVFLFGLGVFVLGYFVQERLYQQISLPFRSYAALVLAILLLLNAPLVLGAVSTRIATPSTRASPLR